MPECRVHVRIYRTRDGFLFEAGRRRARGRVYEDEAATYYVLTYHAGVAVVAVAKRPLEAREAPELVSKAIDYASMTGARRACVIIRTGRRWLDRYALFTAAWSLAARGMAACTCGRRGVMECVDSLEPRGEAYIARLLAAGCAYTA